MIPRPGICEVAGCMSSLVLDRGLCLRHHVEFRLSKKARKRGARKVIVAKAPGTPIRMTSALLGAEEVAVHRRLECSGYDGCLAFTASQDWEGFSCRGCVGPVHA